MFDRHLTAAGLPADGTLCRICRAVARTARRDWQDTPEPARMAQLHPGRGQPARPTAGRRRSTSRPTGPPQLLADAGEVGQLYPIRVRLRRWRITVPARGGHNREGPHSRRAEVAGHLYAADEAGQRLITSSSTGAARRAYRRHRHAGRLDRAGARPRKRHSWSRPRYPGRLARAFPQSATSRECHPASDPGSGPRSWHRGPLRRSATCTGAAVPGRPASGCHRPGPRWRASPVLCAAWLPAASQERAQRSPGLGRTQQQRSSPQRAGRRGRAQIRR